MEVTPSTASVMFTQGNWREKQKPEVLQYSLDGALGAPCWQLQPSKYRNIYLELGEKTKALESYNQSLI